MKPIVTRHSPIKHVPAFISAGAQASCWLPLKTQLRIKSVWCAAVARRVSQPFEFQISTEYLITLCRSGTLFARHWFWCRSTSVSPSARRYLTRHLRHLGFFSELAFTTRSSVNAWNCIRFSLSFFSFIPITDHAPPYHFKTITASVERSVFVNLLFVTFLENIFMILCYIFIHEVIIFQHE